MKNKYFSINELDTPITELPKITPEYEPCESPRELLENLFADSSLLPKIKAYKPDSFVIHASCFLPVESVTGYFILSSS